ncbi:MAG: oligosaccharide flippase family protein, partial [Oscillospiraceae bacterium]|nr:oligosaccharide flippase family protein [Oscillospiraceae bacterium]
MGGYLENALILTASGLALRAAGMGLRVYMAGQLGSEGMGLYQLLFTVYSLSVALATSGVSVAAARMTAEQLGQGRRSAVSPVMRRVLGAAAALGGIAGGLQFVLAGPAARWWLGDERAALSLRILAFSLPFMALGAALRGYFLARRQVKANAGSQMLEQLVRILLVLCLLPRAAQRGLGVGCAAVVTANLVSEGVSCLCMVWAYHRDIRRQENGVPHTPAPRETLRKLWHILAPLEASRSVSSALTAAENALVPACIALAIGDRTQALSAYGALKGMALPVMFFPFSFLGTLATLLMPEVTEAHIRRDRPALERLLDKMMLLTGTVAMLAGGLFTMYAQPLAQLLYRDAEVGFYIRVLGPVMPFMYLESMVDGVLKGMDEQLAT